MRIETLHLKNFRNVEEHTFRFPAMFSVVIGKNGSGKSAILHALRVAAGAYFLGLEEVDKRHIQNDEIRLAEDGRSSLNPQYPVVVQAKGQLHGSQGPIVWMRQVRNKKNNTTFSDKEVGAIKRVAQAKYQAYKDLKDASPLHLPVIAYFGTERLYGAGRKRAKGDRMGRVILEEGYKNWDNMRSRMYQYREWIASYEVLVDEGKEKAESIAVFEKTLRTACPFIGEISFKSGQFRFRVAFEEEEKSPSPLFPPYLHSDGVCMLVEMVAEIAFRCIVLNGEQKEQAVAESRGIVMIDELDVHIHPAWQKTIVQNLKDAFPNIQFVVTTHSPFIVQSVEEAELINLEEILGNHRSEINNPSNYSIEEIAEEEMAVENVERSQKFNRMMDLVEKYAEKVKEGKSSTTDAETARIKQELNRLEEDYESNPALVAVLKMKRLSEQL